MKNLHEALLLYAVTDRTWLCGKTLAAQVESALLGGVTCVQLREKTLSDAEFLAEAVKIKALCGRYGVPLIINDSVEIALESGADGVHIGQGDGDAASVRARLGKNKILGVSARTVEQAVAAEHAGADYLGAGAVFGTSTKADARPVSRETLMEIAAAVRIPVVAIGGVTREKLARLSGTGIAGAAVVSAVFAAADIEKESRALLRAVREAVGTK